MKPNHPMFSPLNCLAVLIALTCLSGCASQSQSDGKSTTNRDTAATSRDSVVVDLAGQDSLTVFDLLQLDHQVDYRATAMGVFVTAIDSVSQSDRAYWIYSINDTMPKIAADKMLTRAGDRIRWHLRLTD